MSITVVPYQIPSVTFLQYDPAYVQLAKVCTEYLSTELTDCTVEHVGSTAIPGMPGKDSVNLLIITKKEHFPTVLFALSKFGFAVHPYKQEPASRPLRVAGILYDGRLFWVHIHLVEAGSTDHLGPLFFRDYLRTHSEKANEYAALKEGLAQLFLSSEEYNAAKQPFIRSILSIQLLP